MDRALRIIAAGNAALFFKEEHAEEFRYSMSTVKQCLAEVNLSAFSISRVMNFRLLTPSLMNPMLAQLSYQEDKILDSATSGGRHK